MKLFLLMLSLSLSGTLIGLLILALRPLTRNYFSAKWNYYIWLLVIIRLLLPFHFDTNFHTDIYLTGRSPAHAADTDLNTTGQTPADTHTANADSDLVKNTTAALINNSSQDTALANTDTRSANTENSPHQDMPSANSPNVVNSNPNHTDTAPAQKLLTIAAALWFMIAVLALMIKLIRYQRFKAAVTKGCVPITDRRVIALKNTFCIRLHIQNAPALYESPAVSGPMTIGLFHPIILLPQSTADERMQPQFELTLHHELIHAARKDLLYKWVYQLLLCLHWFNPLLRYIGRKIDCDCELSCDEQILAQLTETGKKLYGSLLLDTAERALTCRQNTLATTLYSNKNDLKKRLCHIVHYQKIPRFRLIFSVCTLIIALMFTACGTVWISQAENTADEDTQGETDTDTDNDSVLSQLLTSIVSNDGFLGNASAPSQSGDAWKAFDEDALLAGKDNHEQWAARMYRGGGSKIKASGFVLYGTDSFLIAYANQETEIRVTSSFECIDGRFKVIYVAPDQSIVTLNDTGAETTQTITLQKGRNVLKMVGQGAKLKNLTIDYSDVLSALDLGKFESIFSSEEEEKAASIKEAVLSGNTCQKEEVIDVLHSMEPEDVSEVFHDMLRKGTDFTAEELQKFLIYSDEDLSSQYLAEALHEGCIKPLSADAIKKIMPHLAQEYCGELLINLPVDEFYDIFSETIYYLNDEQIEQCLNDYLDRGGVLTYSMFKKISYYLSDSMIEKLDSQLPE